MKKLCSLICAVCLVGISMLSGLTLSATATEYLKEGIFKFYVEDNKAILCDINLSQNYSQNFIKIPDTLLGYEVVEIADIGPYTSQAQYGLIETIYIPASVEKISNEAFPREYFYNVKNLSVDSQNEHFVSVDGILYDKEMKTLVRCPAGLTGKLTVPEGVEKILNAKWCNDITEVALPSSLKEIGDGAFTGCDGLTEITLPENVTTIGAYAFQNCENLTDLNLPESLTTIGDGAFYNIAVASVTIPAFVKSIGTDAFTGGRIAEISVAPESEYFAAVDNILYNKEMTQLLAFPKEIKAINIPDSVTEIKQTFYGCIGISEINVGENNTVFASVDGILYSKDMTTLIRCPQGRRSPVRIPQGVVAVNEDAFTECFDLGYLIVPESVTSQINLDGHYIGVEHVFYEGSEENKDEIFTYGCGITNTAVHCNIDYDIEVEHSKEDATCSAYGSEYIYCPVCQTDIKIRTLLKVDHDYSEFQWSMYGIRGNCYNYKCSMCGDKKLAEPQYSKGDASGDGAVNSTDFMMARRYFLGITSLSDQQIMGADINRDGIVNSTDYMQIRMYYLGLFDID